MNIRFFADTHIAKQVATQLSSLGVDFVRCQDVGLDDADDEILLAYAVTNARIMLTKDDDFLALHSQYVADGREHFGIFYCPYRDIPAIGLIVTICSEYHELISNNAGTIDDLKNKVIYIT